MSNPKCYNCQYAGQKFRAFGMTHVHCNKPEYQSQHESGNHPSAWETLRAWWDKCTQHIFKQEQK